MSTDDTGLNSNVADAAAGTVDNTQTEQTQSDGLNPAWNDLIETLPTQFVPQVTPILKRWDQGVNDRFQTVQSTYAPYKPFIDEGVKPEELQAARALMQALEADPRSFYDKMGEYYAEQWGLGQGQGSDDANDDEYSLDDLDDGQGPEIDLENNPYLRQMKEQQDVLAQVVTQQYQQQQAEQQAKIEAQAEQEVAAEISAIEQKYGPLDKAKADFIFGLALNNEGMTLSQAADQFYAIAGGGQQRPAAVIMSPGGGTPAANINVAELNGKDRRSLVASLLEEAHRANHT
jgi:hypothetical protein